MRCDASLCYAHRHPFYCEVWRPSAIASDRRGPVELAETGLAGADHPEERRGAREFVDHGQDRQVQDLCLALAGAVHARGCQRLASRQVPSAWRSADPAGARRRDRPPDPASAAARGDPLETLRAHGTTTLFAALNVLDGTVIGQNMQRHRCARSPRRSTSSWRRFVQPSLLADRAGRSSRQDDPH